MTGSKRRKVALESLESRAMLSATPSLPVVSAEVSQVAPSSTPVTRPADRRHHHGGHRQHRHAGSSGGQGCVFPIVGVRVKGAIETAGTPNDLTVGGTLTMTGRQGSLTIAFGAKHANAEYGKGVNAVSLPFVVQVNVIGGTGLYANEKASGTGVMEAELDHQRRRQEDQGTKRCRRHLRAEPSPHATTDIGLRCLRADGPVSSQGGGGGIDPRPERGVRAIVARADQPAGQPAGRQARLDERSGAAEVFKDPLRGAVAAPDGPFHGRGPAGVGPVAGQEEAVDGGPLRGSKGLDPGADRESRAVLGDDPPAEQARLPRRGPDLAELGEHEVADRGLSRASRS